MNGTDRTVTLIREWVAKAEDDLKNASSVIRLGHECPVDTVCFHAQQCVEKYLKALLAMEGVDFPKGSVHNSKPTSRKH